MIDSLTIECSPQVSLTSGSDADSGVVSGVVKCKSPFRRLRGALLRLFIEALRVVFFDTKDDNRHLIADVYPFTRLDMPERRAVLMRVAYAMTHDLSDKDRSLVPDDILHESALFCILGPFGPFGTRLALDATLGAVGGSPDDIEMSVQKRELVLEAYREVRFVLRNFLHHFWHHCTCQPDI